MPCEARTEIDNTRHAEAMADTTSGVGRNVVRNPVVHRAQPCRPVQVIHAARGSVVENIPTVGVLHTLLVFEGCVNAIRVLTQMSCSVACGVGIITCEVVFACSICLLDGGELLCHEGCASLHAAAFLKICQLCCLCDGDKWINCAWCAGELWFDLWRRRTRMTEFGLRSHRTAFDVVHTFELLIAWVSELVGTGQVESLGADSPLRGAHGGRVQPDTLVSHPRARKQHRGDGQARCRQPTPEPCSHQKDDAKASSTLFCVHFLFGAYLFVQLHEFLDALLMKLLLLIVQWWTHLLWLCTFQLGNGFTGPGSVKRVRYIRNASFMQWIGYWGYEQAAHEVKCHVRIESVPEEGERAPRRWKRLHPMATDVLCMPATLGPENGLMGRLRHITWDTRDSLSPGVIVWIGEPAWQLIDASFQGHVQLTRHYTWTHCKKTTTATTTIIQSVEAPFQQARSFHPTLGSWIMLSPK